MQAPPSLDAFSQDDFTEAAKNKSSLEILVSGERKFAFYFLEEISEYEAYNLYKEADFSAMEKAFNNGRIIEYKQLEIMKELELMGVVRFYEL